MFLNNLLNEIKLLKRSYWIVVLISSNIFLFAFATLNGNKNVKKRINDISQVQYDLFRKDSTMLITLAKTEKDEKVDIPYWEIPSEPMTIGNRHPRLAIMQPETLSFIATGQSDMYTHFKSPKVYGNNFALDYSEMVNSVQLLFGNFDLSFVIIYLLPLLIIALTYNILSKEKELGNLRLISSQPISIIKWLLQKTIIRFLIFTLITLLILLIILAALSEAYKDISNILNLLLLISAYNMFWFMLALVVNIKINDSSKNTLTLIGCWLLLVLILPASINQIGYSLYPTPSRLKMINEIRLIKKENEEKQNEILDTYLRNHPEMAQGIDKEKFGFWHNYFASEKAMEEKTKPLLFEYESQLKKQQKLIGIFKYLSPSILMQQSLNKIAGTSEKHYNDYKKQVFEFSNEWRNYLVPMLFKQQKFTTQSYSQLPIFNYKNRIQNNTWLDMLVLVIVSILIFFIFVSKRLKNRSAQNYI